MLRYIFFSLLLTSMLTTACKPSAQLSSANNPPEDTEAAKRRAEAAQNSRDDIEAKQLEDLEEWNQEDPKARGRSPIAKQLSINPNPNTGKFTLAFKLRDPYEPVIIRVYDNNTWVAVFEDRTEPPAIYYERFIDLKNLPDGAYRIKLFQGDEIESVKVLIQRM